MTTVRTPRAAAGTVAVAGGRRTLPAQGELPELLLHDPQARLEVLDAPVPDAHVPGADVVDVRGAAPGDRLRRLQQRRRLVREEFLAVMFLVVVLAVTVGVLAMQWLGNGGTLSPASASRVPASSVLNTLSGGPA